MWRDEYERRSLSNGGETITLLDATGQTVQQFAYDDTAPWPTSTDGGGTSLNVVDTDGDYGSSNNWIAAVPSPDAGVTPVATSFVRDSGSIARPDLLDTLTFEFNIGVAINKSDLTLTNATLGGAAVDLSAAGFSYDTNTATATLDLTSLPARLEAGYYDITIDAASVTGDFGGESFDGNDDGIAGGDFVSRVYVAIPGDASLDGVVTASVVNIFTGQQTGDLAITLGNIGATSNVAWALGDFNNDGDVDVNQVNIFSGINEGDSAKVLANLGRDVRPAAQVMQVAQVTQATQVPVRSLPATLTAETPVVSHPLVSQLPAPEVDSFVVPESVQITASSQTSEPVQPVRVTEFVEGPAIEEVVLSASTTSHLPMSLIDSSPVLIEPQRLSTPEDGAAFAPVAGNNLQLDLAGSHQLLDTVFADKAFDDNTETDPDLADAYLTAEADFIDVF